MTTTLQQLTAAQANKEVAINRNFETLSPMGMYGLKQSTTTGLTLGYYGGHIAGSAVADGTIALDGSSTVYVVAHRTTGVVSKATNTTNWDATSTYGRLFKCTTSASTITPVDWREQTGGWFDRAGVTGQPLDSDLTTIAGLTATTDNFMQAKSSAWASRTVAQVTADLQGTGLITDAVGFRTIPQNSQSTAYTTVAADAGKHILHPSGDANARTFTIDSNANVAYPVGTAITFVNETSQVVSIAITSDTLTLAGSTTTGSRSLAQNGVATALKVTSTKWIISGTGLT
jgi:hypothetical protein